MTARNSQPDSTFFDGQAFDLAGLARHMNAKWPAANFAIGRQLLLLDTGIDHKIEALAAVRTCH